jgi:transcriptional regulator with XRE-family HTH domain
MEVSPLRRLGDAIRKRREALSLNQTELGKSVLMSKSNISRIELGELAIEEKSVELFDKALQADGMFAVLWAFVMAGDYSAPLRRLTGTCAGESTASQYGAERIPLLAGS